MGIAIIGTGAIAEVHAEALVRAGRSISAVSGVDEEQVAKFADRFGVQTRYKDSAELLASDLVDSVIIATPSQYHAELAIAALECHKPVLCEVPISLDFLSFERVKKAAESSKAFAAVAQTLRYSEPYMRLKEMLLEQSPESMNILIRRLMFRQENIGWTGVRRTWVDSAVWHHGSHCFDLATWLLGSRKFNAQLYGGPKWSNGEVMEVNGVLRSNSGQTATVNVSYHSRISYNDVVVITESNTFEVSHGRLTCNGETLVSSADGNDSLVDAVGRQNFTFLRAVETGELSEIIQVDELEEVYRLLALVC